jgi:hypothetical protein
MIHRLITAFASRSYCLLSVLFNYLFPHYYFILAVNFSSMFHGCILHYCIQKIRQEDLLSINQYYRSFRLPLMNNESIFKSKIALIVYVYSSHLKNLIFQFILKESTLFPQFFMLAN